MSFYDIVNPIGIFKRPLERKLPLVETIMENEEIKLEEEKKESEAPIEEEKAPEAQEEKVEEKKQENQPKGKGKELVPDVVEIEKLSSDAKPLVAEVEERRQLLFQAYTKTRKMSNFMMVAVVLVVVGAMALLMVNQDWSKIVGYSLAGVALVGLVVFSILTKNKFPTQSKEYIRFVTTRIDQDIYNNTEFQDVKVDLNEKYTLTEVGLDKIYKDLVDIGSRNIVRGLYLGKGFSCGELALYSTKDDGKRKVKAVAFIGKRLDLQNTLHFEGRYILSFQAEKPNDLPTDIDDLEKLHEDGNFTVYGPIGADYAKDIPAKYISELKKIKLEGNLLGLSVVLWAGHTGVYLSYDDPVVALPFDKPFDAEPQRAFKDHLLTVLDAERLINK